MAVLGVLLVLVAAVYSRLLCFCGAVCGCSLGPAACTCEFLGGRCVGIAAAPGKDFAFAEGVFIFSVAAGRQRWVRCKTDTYVRRLPKIETNHFCTTQKPLLRSQSTTASYCTYRRNRRQPHCIAPRRAAPHRPLTGLPPRTPRRPPPRISMTTATPPGCGCCSPPPTPRRRRTARSGAPPRRCWRCSSPASRWVGSREWVVVAGVGLLRFYTSSQPSASNL